VEHWKFAGGISLLEGARACAEQTRGFGAVSPNALGSLKQTAMKDKTNLILVFMYPGTF
jgi:hypothetical protein